MQILQGFNKQGETRVCKLKISLHNLNKFREIGFIAFQKNYWSLVSISQEQTTIYFFIKRIGSVAALVYVDYILLIGNSALVIQKVKLHLDKNFSFKDLGLLKYFLGVVPFALHLKFNN